MGDAVAFSAVKIDFRKLLGFRHVVTLAGDLEFAIEPAGSCDPGGEAASVMAKAAGAIFNKGGELATCESNGTS